MRTSCSRSRRPLDGLAGSSWRIFRDEGISGARGRDKRPGLDALLKGVARREFDVVAAWSVCRLGRSLSDLVGLLGELRSRDVDLYLHQQALDTSTPSGRMLFGMLGVFSEFERAMIRDRVMAGLDRARSSGKRLGRPRTTPFQVQRIRLALDEGRGVRETARLLKVSAAKVSRGQAHVCAGPLTLDRQQRDQNDEQGKAQQPHRSEVREDRHLAAE